MFIAFFLSTFKSAIVVYRKLMFQLKIDKVPIFCYKIWSLNKLNATSVHSERSQTKRYQDSWRHVDFRGNQQWLKIVVFPFLVAREVYLVLNHFHWNLPIHFSSKTYTEKANTLSNFLQEDKLIRKNERFISCGCYGFW